MTKQTFQATNSLIKQPTVQLFQTNPTIQYSDNSFNVKPIKMLSDCGGRGLRPDPPSPTGVNLLPALQISDEISVLLIAVLGFNWNPLWH